jgi:hypothetical protein
MRSLFQASRRCRVVVVAFAAWLAVGCASTSIRSAWYDSSYNGGPMKKILVVGVRGTIADTRVFEDIFAQKLKDAGVDGVPGYLVLPANVPPGEQVWNAAVEASGAQGLLAVRLLGVDTRTQVTTTMMPGPMMWGPYGGWWGPAMVPTPLVTQYDIASVETNLWDIKTRRVIWAATTDTFNPASVPQETPGFAGIIIGQLAARGLIVAKAN